MEKYVIDIIKLLISAIPVMVCIATILIGIGFYKKTILQQSNDLSSQKESLAILQQLHADDIMKLTIQTGDSEKKLLALHDENDKRIAVVEISIKNLNCNVEKIYESVEKIRDKILNGG